MRRMVKYVLPAAAAFCIFGAVFAQSVTNQVTTPAHTVLHAAGVVGLTSANCGGESCTVSGLLCSQGADGNVYVCDGAGSWTQTGSGDVVGPSSATNNSLCRFDTSTGRLIQDTGAFITISDTGTITLAGTSGTFYKLVHTMSDQNGLWLQSSVAGSSPYISYRTTNGNTFTRNNSDGDYQVLEGADPFARGLTVKTNSGDGVAGTMDVHAEAGDLAVGGEAAQCSSSGRPMWWCTGSGTGTPPLGNPGFTMDGSGGDTKLYEDYDTDQAIQVVDGVITTRTENDNWRPPPCPADLNNVPFGGICTEVATGKIRYRGTLEAIP